MKNHNRILKNMWKINKKMNNHSQNQIKRVMNRINGSRVQISNKKWRSTLRSKAYNNKIAKSILNSSISIWCPLIMRYRMSPFKWDLLYLLLMVEKLTTSKDFYMSAISVGPNTISKIIKYTYARNVGTTHSRRCLIVYQLMAR